MTSDGALLDQQLFEPDRQLAHTQAGSVIDRVGDGSGRSHIGDFADTLDAGRVHLIVLFRHENDLKLLDVGVHRHKIVRQVVVDIACPLAIDLGRFMQRRRDAPDHAAHILTARRWPETLLTSRISPAEPTSEASPDARARRRQGRTMSTTDEQKPAGYSHDNKS